MNKLPRTAAAMAMTAIAMSSMPAANSATLLLPPATLLLPPAPSYYAPRLKNRMGRSQRQRRRDARHAFAAGDRTAFRRR